MITLLGRAKPGSPWIRIYGRSQGMRSGVRKDKGRNMTLLGSGRRRPRHCDEGVDAPEVHLGGVIEHEFEITGG